MRKIFYLVVVMAVWLVTCNGPVDPIEFESAWDQNPVWSWSGDKIAFSTYGPSPTQPLAPGIYIIDTSGTNKTYTIPGAVFGTWLPNDTAFVFFKADFKIYLYNFGTQSESLLCDCIFGRFPHASKDGQHIYYEDAGQSDNWGNSIFRMDLLTGDTVRIVPGSIPNLSSSERYLTFERERVYVYDMVADSEWVIFEEGIQAAWAPSDDWILISRFYRTYRNKVVAIRPDGTGAHVLTTGHSARYSRDGKRIALVRPGSDGYDRIFLVNSDGSNPKQITF